MHDRASVAIQLIVDVPSYEMLSGTAFTTSVGAAIGVVEAIGVVVASDEVAEDSEVEPVACSEVCETIFGLTFTVETAVELDEELVTLT